MGLSNELDRNRIELDPKRINPLPSKCIIRRKMAAAKRGALFLPQAKSNKEALFEGFVVKIGSDVPGGYEDVRPGDHVYFSYQVGGDDSCFFFWENSHFAIIPTEAIQAIAYVYVAR